jgi:hypothetical protein
MQPQRHISFVTVIACGMVALLLAAPAALAQSAATAPAFPSAVPAQAGALTGRDSADSAARAQEQYYSSYGDPAPLSSVSVRAGDGGVDWASIGIALGGTCLLIGAAIALVTRRRHTARVRVAA